MINWLKDESEVEDMNGETVYSLDKIRAKYKVIDIHNGWVVINPIADHWLNFAVLNFNQSDGDGKNVLASCVFHGEGTVNGLNECRHTYWGDKGYIFYVNGKTVAEAFKVLSQFFEELV